MVCFLILHLDRIHEKLIEATFLFNCPRAADVLSWTGVFGSAQCARMCVYCAVRSGQKQQLFPDAYVTPFVPLRNLLVERDAGCSATVKSGTNQECVTAGSWC